MKRILVALKISLGLSACTENEQESHTNKHIRTEGLK